jgi:hypothetical protein
MSNHELETHDIAQKKEIQKCVLQAKIYWKCLWALVGPYASNIRNVERQRER